MKKNCSASVVCSTFAFALLFGIFLPPSLAFATPDTKPDGLTDITTTSSGTTVAGSSCYDQHSGYDSAFDGSYKGNGGRWLATKNSANVYYVTYKFYTPTPVNGIQLATPVDGGAYYNTRGPKAWTFQASNDNSNWVVLDTRTNETSWDVAVSNYYGFANDTPYLYYKFNCTANNGETSGTIRLQLGEIEFYYTTSYPSTASWVGNGETQYLSDSGNWSEALPGFSSMACINSTGDSVALVPDAHVVYANMRLGNEMPATLRQTQGRVSVGGITIGRYTGGNGRYEISGGALDVYCQPTPIFVSAYGGTGVLDISGTGTVKAHIVSGDVGVCFGHGNPSHGTINVSENGTLNSGGMLRLGNVAGDESTLNISGNGTVIAGNDIQIAYIASSTGMVNQTGGSVKFTNTRGFWLSVGLYGTGTYTQSGGSILGGASRLILGNYSSSTGEYRLSGGTAHMGNCDIGGRNSASASGSMYITGGTLYIADAFTVGYLGTGYLEVSDDGELIATNSLTTASQSGSTGGMKVHDGGKIVTKAIAAGSGKTTFVEFDDAVLGALGANSAFLSGITNLVLKAGGVAIESGGYNLGIASSTLYTEPNAKISVTGGGTFTFDANTSVVLTAKPSGPFTLAETDGTFANVPTLSAPCKCSISLSSDSKRITVAPLGLIILFR